MTAVYWIAAGLAAFVLLVVMIALRGPLGEWAHTAFVPRKAHLLVLAVALAVAPGGAMIVSLAGRVKLDGEIRKRIDAEAAQAERARASLRRILRLEAPTTADFVRVLGRFDELCFTDRACADRFIRALNRNIQVSRSGEIVRAKPGMPPAARRLPPPAREPRPAPVAPGPVIPRPPVPRPAAPDPRIDKLVADVASLRRQVQELRDRRPVNSATLDGLEDRLADAERGLQDLVGTVQGVAGGLQNVTEALCAPALARLLTALRICR